MAAEIIQNNFACVVLCLLFIQFIVADRSFESKTKGLFLITVFVTLTLVVVDSMELFKAQLSYPTLTRKICSAIGYALRPCSPALLMCIVCENSNYGKYKTLSKKYLLPLAVNAVCVFLSILNGWVFFYTGDNAFVRGPLWWVPFVVSAYYLIMMTFVTVSSRELHRREEDVIVFFMVAFSILGVAMEVFWKFEGTLNAVAASCALFYYLYLHVAVYAIDDLTLTYNRRIFTLDCKKWQRRTMIVVSIDMNDLKAVNDTKGHAAGDRELMEMARAIKNKVDRRKCTLYRTGGDEFAMLCHKMTLKEVETMLYAVTKGKGKAPYSFAFGCALYTEGENMEEAYREADKRMYEMKNAMKKK